MPSRFLAYAGSLIGGWLVAWGLSELVRFVFPWAAMPVFYTVAIWWTFIGFVYVFRRERYEASRRISHRG
jgi:hypothetical protein